MDEFIDPRTYVDNPGVLTANQRDYLIDGKDYPSKQSEWDIRQRIRDKLRSAVYDYSVLLGHLPTDQREQVFRKVLDPWQYASQSRPLGSHKVEGPPEAIQQRLAFFDSLAAQLAFVMLGCADVNLDFDRILTFAKRKAKVKTLEDKTGMEFVGPDLDPTTMVTERLEVAAQKIGEGESITRDEFYGFFSLFLADAGRFMELLSPIDIDLEALRAGSGELGPGEALLLFAHFCAGDVQITQEIAARMPEEVAEVLGVGSFP